MNIRLATPADGAALLNIYAQYIDTPITFECVLPTEQEFAERVRGIVSEYPYLACEEGGRIIGYAYAHRHKERAAYQWGAELSIYLGKTSVSRGLGRNLYGVLLEILKLQGVRTVYGGVTVPNDKSEKLHAALGFTRLGSFHNTGYKCGKWHDVAWFEKQIAPYDAEPQPIVPIHSLSTNKLTSILQKSLEHFTLEMLLAIETRCSVL